MLLIYTLLGAVLLLASAWVIRRAWQSFVLEMEGYEFGDDADYIRDGRRKSRERREALAHQCAHLVRCGAALIRKARSGGCSHSA